MESNEVRLELKGDINRLEDKIVMMLQGHVNKIESSILNARTENKNDREEIFRHFKQIDESVKELNNFKVKTTAQVASIAVILTLFSDKIIEFVIK